MQTGTNRVGWFEFWRATQSRRGRAAETDLPLGAVEGKHRISCLASPHPFGSCQNCIARPGPSHVTSLGDGNLHKIFPAIRPTRPDPKLVRYCRRTRSRREATARVPLLMQREFPRLCRGGSRSLTFPGVGPGYPLMKLWVVGRPSIRAKYAVSHMIGFVDGKIPIHLARVYGEHRQNFVGWSFQARGYFVSTVGRDEKAIEPTSGTRRRRASVGADESLALTATLAAA
jgi:hypothetical protein